MMVLCLLLRPWLMHMRSINVVPRILADDIFIVSHGPGHLERFAHAYDETFAYLDAIGAKAAPKKSYTFSSCPNARAWLRTHIRKNINTCINNVLHYRDLGAHFSAGTLLSGATLLARFKKARLLAMKIGRLPISFSDKVHLVAARVLPMALYGVEVQPINDKWLASLSSAIVPALGPNNTRCSHDIVFLLAEAHSMHVDPNIDQLLRRARLLRTQWHKKP